MNQELKNKIAVASEVIDKIVDFTKIASKIQNKPVKLVVSMFEVVDGYVFKTALTEVVNYVPEKFHPVVGAYLDAFIAKDYLLVVDKTAEMLTALNLIPLVEADDEKRVYTAILIALVRLIPQGLPNN